MINSGYWKGKKVLITGHTGFKGSWLSLWLNYLGANVLGYSLKPPTKPSLFELCHIEKDVETITGDIRDYESLSKAIIDFRPDLIFHLAAQAIVSESYINPLYTYSTNVMGTVNLLEAVRRAEGVRAVINITTDKCYENKEWYWGYRENDRLGGYDPYSNSKACSELVTSSFRDSFFNKTDYDHHRTGIATARAGNVIGGGDWAVDRLIPDCIRSILNGEKIHIRNPGAIRPWQHVLEPLQGYLLLAEKLLEDGATYDGAWNFGPNDDDARTVEWIVKKICLLWGNEAAYTVDKGIHPHETNCLKLDCSKAKKELGWKPVWNISKALEKIIEWADEYKNNGNLKDICFKQIAEFENDKAEV